LVADDVVGKDSGPPDGTDGLVVVAEHFDDGSARTQFGGRGKPIPNLGRRDRFGEQQRDVAAAHPSHDAFGDRHRRQRGTGDAVDGSTDGHVAPIPSEELIQECSVGDHRLDVLLRVGASQQPGPHDSLVGVDHDHRFAGAAISQDVGRLGQRAGRVAEGLASVVLQRPETVWGCLRIDRVDQKRQRFWQLRDRQSLTTGIDQPIPGRWDRPQQSRDDADTQDVRVAKRNRRPVHSAFRKTTASA